MIANLMWLIGTNDALTFNCTHCFVQKFCFPDFGFTGLGVRTQTITPGLCLLTSLPSVCFRVFLRLWPRLVKPKFCVSPYSPMASWSNDHKTFHSWTRPGLSCKTTRCKTTRCEPLRFFLRFFARALSLVCSDESMYTSFMKAFHHLKTRIIWKIL